MKNGGLSNCVFVRLMSENVDVWRPVRAKRIDGMIYMILGQKYDSDIETWQFVPGDKVVCEYVKNEDGQILVAKGKV